MLLSEGRAFSSSDDTFAIMLPLMSLQEEDKSDKSDSVMRCAGLQ